MERITASIVQSDMVIRIRAALLLLLPLVAQVAAAPAATRQTSGAPAVVASQTAASPAERQFRAWLRALSEDDDRAYRAFLADRFPSRVARAEADLAFRSRTGGFDILRIEAATATTVTGLVRERAWDQFARVELTVDGAPPHRIQQADLRGVPRPADMSAPPMTEQELLAGLRRKLDAEVQRDAFSGAVLVARHGKIVFSAALGLASREARTPNTLDTRFRIGSMNKMFTATAILQLAQAGKLKLEDPLGRYLTDYPNKDVASKVTIHHLLTHTGGTGNIFTPEYFERRLETRTLADYVTLFGARPLRFEPGSRYEYSNYGFLLLGVLVERISGQSYYDYVRDHIYKPAGMASSGSDPEDRPVPNRSTGYMRRDGAWVSNADTLPYRGTSAGGGYTTVGDLLRFATALAGHTLLNAQFTALLTTGKVEAGPTSKYAYGFIDRADGGGRNVGHSGGAPGMNGELRIFTQSGYVVVALANMDSGASQVAAWISERLPK